MVHKLSWLSWQHAVPAQKKKRHKERKKEENTNTKRQANTFLTNRK
jgi:hypothetical protein